MRNIVNNKPLLTILDTHNQTYDIKVLLILELGFLIKLLKTELLIRTFGDFINCLQNYNDLLMRRVLKYHAKQAKSLSF